MKKKLGKAQWKKAANKHRHFAKVGVSMLRAEIRAGYMEAYALAKATRNS